MSESPSNNCALKLMWHVKCCVWYRSSVIWEVKKKRNKWITLNNENIFILEEAYKKDPNSVIEGGKVKVKRMLHK